jgi:hypothetical protein
MKRRDCLAAYQDYSRQVSANVRQLGFAAIAVIWLFKVSTEDKAVALSTLLVWAGGLFVASLFFDFLHYLAGTITWGWFHRSKELAGVSQEEDFQAPLWINWTTTTLFVLKVSCTGLGYVLLLLFFWQTIVIS